MGFFLSRTVLSTVIREWQLLCLALMFFTRFPVPKSTPYSEQRMNQANRYFSLVGLMLGVLTCLCFYWLSLYFSIAAAITLTLIVSIAFTGAFHEDGLADMADGIGGGLTSERRLVIMKDSRIGTYGAVSLCLILLFKFVLWSDLAKLGLFIPSILLSYALSRAIAASLIINTAYVSDNDSSKSKPVAAKQSSLELIILVVIGCLPVFFFIEIASFSVFVLSLFTVLVSFRYIFRKWLIKRIGGLTGDCLGAAQQISEVLIYLVILFHLQQISDPTASLVQNLYVTGAH